MFRQKHAGRAPANSIKGGPGHHIFCENRKTNPPVLVATTFRMIKARLKEIDQDHKEALTIPDSPIPGTSGVVQISVATIMPTQVTSTPNTARTQLIFSPVSPIEIDDAEGDRYKAFFLWALSNFCFNVFKRTTR